MEKLESLKGIHPGAYLSNELKKRGIRPGKLALSLGVYPQTMNAIMKTRRGMNITLSLKIEQALGLSEGLLMSLQVFYDIKIEKTKRNRGLQPNLSKLRKGLFWDTDINNIDWIGQKESVIERVTSRGNQLEIEEIKQFYLRPDICALTNDKIANDYPLFK